MKAFFPLLLAICVPAGLIYAGNSATLPSLSAQQTLHLQRRTLNGLNETAGRISYLKTEFAELATRDNKLVDVTGEVIAIDVRQQFISLYDAQTKKLLRVSLKQLPRQQRRILLFAPIHFASVQGQLESREGRFLLTAHKITPQQEMTER